jgi:hypothetical protein
VLMNDKTQQDDDEQQQQNCDCWKCRRDEQFRLQANAMPLQETSETLAALFHSTQTTPQSLSTDDFCVKRSLVLQHARQFTTCASCLNAVRTLRLQDHPLLEYSHGDHIIDIPGSVPVIDQWVELQSIATPVEQEEKIN